MAGSDPVKKLLEDAARQGIRNRNADQARDDKETSPRSITGPEKNGGDPDREKEILGSRNEQHEGIEPMVMGSEKNDFVNGEVEGVEPVGQGDDSLYGSDRLLRDESISSRRSEMIFSRLSIRSRKGSGMS